MKFQDMEQVPTMMQLPPDVVRLDGQGQCHICSWTTSYAELNYECWICSMECLDIMDEGFNAAMRSVVDAEKGSKA